MGFCNLAKPSLRCLSNDISYYIDTGIEKGENATFILNILLVCMYEQKKNRHQDEKKIDEQKVLK